MVAVGKFESTHEAVVNAIEIEVGVSIDFLDGTKVSISEGSAHISANGSGPEYQVFLEKPGEEEKCLGCVRTFDPNNVHYSNDGVGARLHPDYSEDALYIMEFSVREEPPSSAILTLVGLYCDIKSIVAATDHYSNERVSVTTKRVYKMNSDGDWIFYDEEIIHPPD